MNFRITICILLLFARTLKAQWEPTNLSEVGSPIYSLLSLGTNIIAETPKGVYLSSDGGNNWNNISNGLPTDAILSTITGNENYLFVGTFNKGIFVSTNTGSNWTSADSGLPSINTSILALAGSGSNIYAGTQYGVYISTDNGIEWSAANNGMPAGPIDIISLAIDGEKVCAGSDQGYGVYFSTDKGSSWTGANSGLPTLTGYPSSYISFNAIAMSSSNIFVGTSGSGIYLSTNNGTSWTAANSGFPEVNFNQQLYVYSLAVISGNIVAGTSDGIYISTNNGSTWDAKNEGLSNINVYSIASSGDKIFIGIRDGSVWVRSFTDIITNVMTSGNKLSYDFSLSQNYPNPFNPTTTIEYDIPTTSNVIIEVFDILGRKIAILLNKEQTPGHYRTEFNGSKLNSGIYFYKIKAGNLIQTKKMILIK